MAIFKMLFFVAIAFFSAVAIFIGTVTLLTSLQNGAITLGYNSGGKAVSETVTQAADSARYWRLLLTMGLLPAVLGAAAMWYSVRKLKGR